MHRSLIGIAIVTATILFATAAHADKSRVLVLPLPASSSIDADIARAFDARLLVALEDTGKVATLTPSDEPECTTLACLADLGAASGASFVLSLSVLRETEGLTLFATLIDSNTAAASRRAELSGLNASDVARSAPADLARQIAAGGTTASTAAARTGPAVVGVTLPAAGNTRAAATAITDKLAGLQTFTVIPLDKKADRSTVTHRAQVSLRELSINKRVHHVHHYLDGVLVGTLSIMDLSDGRVVFTKTVSVTVSKRFRYSSTAEVTALLIEGAVADWMSAFHAAGIETSLKGGT